MCIVHPGPLPDVTMSSQHKATDSDDLPVAEHSIAWQEDVVANQSEGVGIEQQGELA